MGKLYLTVGPMFSGKSKKLLRYCLTNSRCIFVRSKLDTRPYLCHDETVDDSKINIIRVSKLNELENNFDCLCIDEGHLFEDLYEFVKELIDNTDKNVYVAALNGDFAREVFENVSKLFSICDDIEMLKAKCFCGENAIFSHRISKNENKILIGGAESYVPLCRKCYNLYLVV